MKRDQSQVDDVRPEKTWQTTENISPAFIAVSVNWKWCKGWITEMATFTKARQSIRFGITIVVFIGYVEPVRVGGRNVHNSNQLVHENTCWWIIGNQWCCASCVERSSVTSRDITLCVTYDTILILRHSAVLDPTPPMTAVKGHQHKAGLVKSQSVQTRGVFPACFGCPLWKLACWHILLLCLSEKACDYEVTMSCQWLQEQKRHPVQRD